MNRRVRAIALTVLLALAAVVASVALTTVVIARSNGITPRELVDWGAYRWSRIGKSPQPFPEPASSRDERWRQDLAYLGRELPRLHANAFHTVTRTDFEDAVAVLDTRIPILSDDQITVELARIVASIGDGHTATWTWMERFRRYPLAFRWLDGEPWIVQTDEAHTHLLGTRVIRFGNLDVADALERVRGVLSSDSEGDFLRRAQNALAYAELTAALEVQASDDAGRFLVQDRRGREQDVTIEPLAPGASIDWRRAGAVPAYLERPGEDHWMRVLPGGRVYLRFARSREPEEFRGPARQVLAALDAYRDSVLIVDLRGNPGGDERVIEPLLEGIRTRGLGSSGRLWALTDAGTFSSATGNAHSLRRLGARIAGEPTGDGVDGYGEVELLTLENSGIQVSYATRYWRRMGSEAPLEPDLPVRPTIDDVLTGHDPVLTAVEEAIGEGMRPAGVAVVVPN